jgi:hypothetical protein
LLAVRSFVFSFENLIEDTGSFAFALLVALFVCFVWVVLVLGACLAGGGLLEVPRCWLLLLVGLLGVRWFLPRTKHTFRSSSLSKE